MPPSLPTPNQTQTLLRSLIDRDRLTASQFRDMHHLGAGPVEHFHYLCRINSYQDQGPNNLALHYKLETFAEQFNV